MGKRLFIAAVVFGLVSYAIAFYATPLTSICDDTGKPLTRAAVVWQLFWLPDQYLFPNWFGSPTSFTILDRVPVMLAAGAMVGWASLLGWLLCRAFRLESWLTRLEMFVFSAAVGLSLVSTWVLLLGLLGVMNAGAMFWAPALLTVAGGGYVFLRERGQHAVASESWSPRWLWLAVPFAAVIVLAAMVPRLDFDVREYHLQAPKEFFEQGQITFLPHNVYANMAMGTEMLSLLAMVLTGKWWLGALVGKTVIAMFAPLTALGLVATVFAVGGRCGCAGLSVDAVDRQHRVGRVCRGCVGLLSVAGGLCVVVGEKWGRNTRNRVCFGAHWPSP
jgi:MFS family permease